jgi:hypothetical protein
MPVMKNATMWVKSQEGSLINLAFVRKVTMMRYSGNPDDEAIGEWAIMASFSTDEVTQLCRGTRDECQKYMAALEKVIRRR